MALSFKQRIMLAVTLAAVVPMAVVGGVTAYMGFEASKYEAEQGLLSMNDATAERLNDYLEMMLKSVRDQAGSPIVVEALPAFIEATRALDPATMKVDEVKLKERYVYQQEKTRGAQAGDAEKWLAMDPLAKAMQTLYIADNPNKIGEKQKLDTAEDGSAYAQVHAKYHPSFRAFVENLGLYDVFLIDAETQRVVYTNFKEIDFMSSVKEGPLADTGFSRVVKQALASTDPKAVLMSDLQPYMPSYNDGAIFMASPVVINGKTVGAFAIQLPTDKVFGVFSSLAKLGETVDGFVAGSDEKFRTPQTSEGGKVGDTLNAALARELKNVFSSKKDGIYNYAGEDGGAMTGAFKLLSYPGQEWVLVVGQDDEEMLEASIQQLYIVGGILGAVVLISLVIGWFLGDRLSAPVVKMGKSFGQSAEKVGRSTGMVGDAVASMIAASEETSAQSVVVRKNSNEAAGYMSSVSSAVEELNVSIHDISQSIGETNILVDDAVAKAQRTDEVVRKLGEASNRITEVVSLINDLAAQTNLLALNAAIEAARAGDAGRGFAVVADEVKKLASHTTQATVDIGAQVQEIQSVSQESVHVLQTVVEAIHRIRDNATAVSAAVEEQSGVAKQISGSVRDAAQRVQQVDDNMTGIEQAANDTGVAADQVNLAVTEVQGAFGDMKTQMAKTLNDLGVKA